MGLYFPDPLPEAAAHAPAHSHHAPGKLLRLDAEFAEACRRQDVDWLSRHLADDFRCIGGDGALLSRAEFIAGDGRAAGAPLALQEAEVQFEGDTAIVRCIAVTATARERHLDVWVGRDGRWQLLAAQRTAIADSSPC